MKKIMFNDRCGLTDAVLKGRKTMTRRVIPQLLNVEDPEISEWGIQDKGLAHITLYEGGRPSTDIFPSYQPGETVAIAQRYSELSWDEGFYNMLRAQCERLPQYELAGWGNKMFVKAEHMPHQIKFMNVKVERLQDISEEDAIKEGIFKYEKPPLHHEFDPFSPWPPYIRPYKHDNDNFKYCCSARYAFAYLIDKVSGKGTWDLNPWVFVYEFKLVK